MSTFSIQKDNLWVQFAVRTEYKHKCWCSSKRGVQNTKGAWHRTPRSLHVSCPAHGNQHTWIWSQKLGRQAVGLRPLACWSYGFESRRRHGCCECCVLSGRGLCDGLITRPEESCRVWCVNVVPCNSTLLHLQWIGRRGQTKKERKRKKERKQSIKHVTKAGAGFSFIISVLSFATTKWCYWMNRVIAKWGLVLPFRTFHTINDHNAHVRSRYSYSSSSVARR